MSPTTQAKLLEILQNPLQLHVTAFIIVLATVINKGVQFVQVM